MNYVINFVFKFSGILRVGEWGSYPFRDLFSGVFVLFVAGTALHYSIYYGHCLEAFSNSNRKSNFISELVS